MFYPTIKNAIDKQICPFCNKSMELNTTLTSNEIDINNNFLVIIEPKLNNYSVHKYMQPEIYVPEPQQYNTLSISLNQQALPNYPNMAINYVAAIKNIILTFECKAHKYFSVLSLETNYSDFSINLAGQFLFIPQENNCLYIYNDSKSNKSRIRVLDKNIFNPTLDLSPRTYDLMNTYNEQDLVIDILPFQSNSIDYLTRTVKMLLSF